MQTQDLFFAFLFLQCLEHRRKVNQLPSSKPKEEEEEKIPTEKEKDDVEQEAKPPLNAGNEDLQVEKESVSDLESVVNLFSAKVRINSDLDCRDTVFHNKGLLLISFSSKKVTPECLIHSTNMILRIQDRYQLEVRFFAQ